MKRKSFNWALITAGTLTSVACATTTQAQSVDALLDKLVDKGILTTKEANELKEETDQGFTKAYQVKSGMPEWVTSLKFHGDLRLRYDAIHSDNSAFVDRNRARYRLRFGATAVLKDNLEVGLRLMSGEGTTIGGVSDPISGNTTFDNNGAKKGIFIDLAYGKWTAINNANWSAVFTGGKMENPFVFSDIMFDPDYTPEGVAAQFAYNVNDNHVVKMNLGGFALDEQSLSSRDPYMVGAQLRLDSKWNPKVQTSAGAALLNIAHREALVSGAVPNQNRGNTRDATGSFGALPLAHNFNPIVGDAALTYTLESFPGYIAPFPIKVGGDFVYNPGADKKNKGFSAGVTFGKSGKKRLWELGYRYKYLGADSWFEELVDSDFGAFYQTPQPNTGDGAGYRAGTNLRGHVIRAAYSPTDAFTFGVTYHLARTISTPQPNVDSEVGRIQVDAIFKF